MAKNPFNTTAVRASIQGVFSAVIGSVTAWLVAKWGTIHSAWLVAMAPGFSAVYYLILGWLKKKFPSLGWLFGQLPQPPVSPTPAPTPTPTPASSTFVETDKGVWAADVNAMEKANEVAKTPPTPPKTSRPSPKTKR